MTYRLDITTRVKSLLVVVVTHANLSEHPPSDTKRMLFSGWAVTPRYVNCHDALMTSIQDTHDTHGTHVCAMCEIGSAKQARNKRETSETPGVKRAKRARNERETSAKRAKPLA